VAALRAAERQVLQPQDAQRQVGLVEPEQSDAPPQERRPFAKEQELAAKVGQEAVQEAPQVL